MKLAAVISAAVLGFALSALLGIKLVPWLHKLKFGQTILDIGPNWHKQKQGTPTMGGIGFALAALLGAFGVCLWSRHQNGPVALRLFLVFSFALACGTIGFLDDFLLSKDQRFVK